VDSAIATVWLIERYDAFTSNPGEDGLARPDWSEVLGQLIGTSGYASSGESENAPAAAKLRLRVSGNMVESPLELRLLKTILS